MADKGKKRSRSPHEEGEKGKKRVKLSSTDIREMSRERIISRWKEQEAYIDHLLSLLEAAGADEVAKLKETETRLQLRLQEAQRRENVLNMRLATKQQETQEIMSQMHDLKQSQTSDSSQLHSLMVDPAVNIMFSSMKRQLKNYKEKLEHAQNDLSAWKFTPDSVTGKKMMAKCRSLIQENAELGKQISQGRVAQLEAEIALHKKFNQEIKNAQDELNEFVIQLDEEADAMQATVLSLQLQLKTARDSTTAAATKPAGNHGDSSVGSKDRTSSRYNGPVETAEPSSSSKTSARSSDS